MILTPMQELAMRLLKEKGELHPGTLAHEWYLQTRGSYIPAASRDRFGTTSASYKTLYKLRSLGLVKSNGRTFKLIKP